MVSEEQGASKVQEFINYVLHKYAQSRTNIQWRCIRIVGDKGRENWNWKSSSHYKKVIWTL